MLCSWILKASLAPNDMLASLACNRLTVSSADVELAAAQFLLTLKVLTFTGITKFCSRVLATSLMLHLGVEHSVCHELSESKSALM